MQCSLASLSSQLGKPRNSRRGSPDRSPSSFSKPTQRSTAAGSGASATPVVRKHRLGLRAMFSHTILRGCWPTPTSLAVISHTSPRLKRCHRSLLTPLLQRPCCLHVPCLPASRYTKAGKLASLPALLPPDHSALHRVIPKQANLRVCLLCSRPTIASCIALYQSRQTCEFACFPSHPTIPLASRYTKAGKLAPALLPAQPYRLAPRYTKASKLASLLSVLHRVIPQPANLRVCLLCSRPTIASCLVLYQGRL